MPVQENIVKRLTSTDDRADAVLVTRDAGATTSVGYDLFIVPKGQPLSKDDHAVFIADHPDGLGFEWVGTRGLAIWYAKARVFHFTNFWHDKRLDNFQYEVKITEKETGPPVRSDGKPAHNRDRSGTED